MDALVASGVGAVGAAGPMVGVGLAGLAIGAGVAAAAACSQKPDVIDLTASDVEEQEYPDFTAETSAFLSSLKLTPEKLADFTEQANAASESSYNITIEWNSDFETMAAIVAAKHTNLLPKFHELVGVQSYGTILLAVHAYLGRGGDIESPRNQMRWRNLLKMSSKADIEYAVEYLLESAQEEPEDNIAGLSSDWSVTSKSKKAVDAMVEQYKKEQGLDKPEVEVEESDEAEAVSESEGSE